MASTIESDTLWEANSIAWSGKTSNSSMYLAVGSFSEDHKNKLRLLHFDSKSLVTIAEENHAFPITKLQWKINRGSSNKNILATAGDALRLWSCPRESDFSTNESLLKNVSSLPCSNKDSNAPISSLDWNEIHTNLLAISCLDTTCAVFDVEKEQIKTQLIAHDKEVYDVAFQDSEVFGSVGADGSVRLFDMRNLEHSTIIYETNDGSPLVRLCWNKQDPNYLATFQSDSLRVIVIDVRYPASPLTELMGHSSFVNCACFAPHSSAHLITGGEDRQALVYDLSQIKRKSDAVLMYVADGEVNEVSWSKDFTEWIAISCRNRVKALKI